MSSCGNRRNIPWYHKPGEIIGYTQSFSSVLDTGITNINITTLSIGVTDVTILNESVNTSTAEWGGQFLMLSEGNGVVEIKAEFSDGRILYDYFHLCCVKEQVVNCC